MAGHSAATRAKLSAAAKERSYVHTCACGAVVETSTPNWKRCVECRAEHERARLAEKSRRQRERGYVSPYNAPKARRERLRGLGVRSRRWRNAERRLATAARGTKSRVWFMVDSAGQARRYHRNMALAVKRAYADPELRAFVSERNRARMTPELRAELSARWTPERRRQASIERGGNGKTGAGAKRKRKQRLSTQRGKYFRPLDVFEADDYVCQLCGEPCERDKVAPGGKKSGKPVSVWAPTIDHIVPLAKGGLHCRDNVQTAHFRCNSRKTDSVAA